MTPIDPLRLASDIAAVLDQLGIPYVIDGSVASSVLAEPRTTLDLDIMIDADETKVRRLVASLAESFYVSEDASRYIRASEPSERTACRRSLASGCRRDRSEVAGRMTDVMPLRVDRGSGELEPFAHRD